MMIDNKERNLLIKSNQARLDLINGNNTTIEKFNDSISTLEQRNEELWEEIEENNRKIMLLLNEREIILQNKEYYVFN